MAYNQVDSGIDTVFGRGPFLQLVVHRPVYHMKLFSVGRRGRELTCLPPPPPLLCGGPAEVLAKVVVPKPPPPATPAPPATPVPPPPPPPAPPPRPVQW